MNCTVYGSLATTRHRAQKKMGMGRREREVIYITDDEKDVLNFKSRSSGL
jgi:hypothetical protein